jgi:hypothetical protein
MGGLLFLPDGNLGIVVQDKSYTQHSLRKGKQTRASCMENAIIFEHKILVAVSNEHQFVRSGHW